LSKKNYDKIFQEPARECSGDVNRDCKRSRRYKDIRDIDQLEDLPKRQPMKPRDDWSGRKQKVELYGPLKKFLRSRVGKSWNKIYSEFCHKSRSTNIAHYNARKMLKYYVRFNVYEKDDDIYQITCCKPLIDDGQTFYVDSCGILRVPKRRALKRSMHLFSNAPEIIEYYPDGPQGERWQKLSGIWYRCTCEYRRGDQFDEHCFDKQLRPVRKQLSKKDLKRIPQTIRDR